METLERPRPEKPLGHRAYGSIPHLPGSRRGPADKGLSDDQARILTDKARDRHDIITVQEKLDGSCVSVAKLNGQVVALIRAGYPATGSNYSQHHAFAVWVEQHKSRFDALLSEGERVCGEWLMEAHGTIYKLTHEPFVAFDIMRGHDRTLAATVLERCASVQFVTPRIIHVGGPIQIATVLTMLEPSGHGATDGVEGAVWRCERKGAVDFLGKYVRPDKIDGKYLESITGGAPIYNWRPMLANDRRGQRIGARKSKDMSNENNIKTSAARADSPAPTGYAAGDDRDDDHWDDEEWDGCGMCGGDGIVMLSECGPSEWGEDCFCEVDRPVACPECRERERYEAFRKQQKTMRHTEKLCEDAGK